MDLNSKQREKKSFFKSLMSKNNSNFDDVIPFDDMKYFDDYEDVILNDDMLSFDKINLRNEFYYNDDIDYFE